MVNVDGISEGCNIICEGSIVDVFVPGTGDADGTCEAHPAIPTERMMKQVIKIIINVRDCFFMSIYTPL